MNKKFLIGIIIVMVAAGLAWAGRFYWKNLRGAGPAFLKPGENITTLFQEASQNKTGLPLKLPDNFSIEIFAQNLPGARVIIQASGGLLVSQASEGKITQLLMQDNKVASQKVLLSGLNNPHGLALDPSDNDVLYYAEENKISKFNFGSKKSEKIIDLPSGGEHTTRTIAFGPDGRLYVSIGSTCNVCMENDARRAAIYSLNKDGSDFKEVAGGLRNSVFFTWSYVDGRMWATDNGRDYLGDDLPPDEINIIEPGKNYGWPICYGQNIHDSNFDKNQYIQNPCNGKIPPAVEIPAHSAPLGLAFVPEEGWPEQYWYNLFVAYHGSWNKSTPTGYKVVRIKLDSKGNYLGTEDFITGWLKGGTALGRPVDILTVPGGGMYITDDKAGVVYRVTYSTQQSQEEKIKLDNLKQNQVIASPLKITGQAKNEFFFEASFPIILIDSSGKVLAQTHAQATEDWMKEGFVSFEATLEFKAPTTDTGKIIFKKDNPSGLPQNAGQVELPVRFR